MQFFVDSADVKEIEYLVNLGLVDGVTTNPSLMAKNKGNFFDIAKEICNLVSNSPVSLEVVGNEYDVMIEQGHKLFEIAQNVVIKLPLTKDGLKACKYFSLKNIPVNMTLCFSVNQALLAAKAGATYVSPFIGRLDDVGEDGLNLISEIKNIFINYPNLQCKILAASIRNPIHVAMCAKIGADYATLPAKIFDQLIAHPLTDKGLAIFDADWKKSGLKID